MDKQHRSDIVRGPGMEHQPDPASYDRARLVGWLTAAAAGQRSRLAAIHFLNETGSWIDRADWRDRCVTVVGHGGPFEPAAFIEWEQWGMALAENAEYERARLAHELFDGIQVGLTASHHERRTFALVRWLWHDSADAGGLDVPTAAALLSSVAILTDCPTHAWRSE
jgi:hypothetical protein